MHSRTKKTSQHLPISGCWLPSIGSEVELYWNENIVCIEPADPTGATGAMSQTRSVYPTSIAKVLNDSVISPALLLGSALPATLKRNQNAWVCPRSSTSGVGVRVGACVGVGVVDDGGVPVALPSHSATGMSTSGM